MFLGGMTILLKGEKFIHLNWLIIALILLHVVVELN